MVLSASQETRSDEAPSRRRRWRARPRPEAIARGEYTDVIGRLLAMRGVSGEDAARAFLGEPAGQPDPYALPALDIAIERLLLSVRQRETVAVFGDFDVDGVTSAAQLSQAIASLGGVPLTYVPDRFTEGYGLNVRAIERLRGSGVDQLHSRKLRSFAEVAFQ